MFFLILHAKVFEAQILLLGGVLVVVWRWFLQKAGVGLGESGVGFGVGMVFEAVERVWV